MRDPFAIREIPQTPGVYCLLGYSARGAYAAYVGIGGNLRVRVSQHLEYRNSSVTTGASAVALDANQISGCQWWTHDSLSDRDQLSALEILAFEELSPVLRSRGGVKQNALDLSRDPKFREWAIKLLANPSGQVAFPGIIELASEIRELKQRVQALEQIKTGKK